MAMNAVSLKLPEFWKSSAVVSLGGVHVRECYSHQGGKNP